MPLLETDVCIIGGGPAGSILAIRLIQLGYRVAILERARFPRQHVGESLPAPVLPLLRFLQLEEVLDDPGFIRSCRAMIRWEGVIHTKEMEESPATLVDRALFDQSLLERACKAGAMVLQPCAPGAARQSGDGGWEVPYRMGPDDGRLTCRFLADAAGRSGFLRGVKERTTERTVAIHAHWKRHRPCAEMYVEAGEDHWIWGAAVPGGEFHAMLFVDPAAIAGKAGEVAKIHEAKLGASQLMRHFIEGGRTTEVKVCDATGYFSRGAVGRNWIRTGEAAHAIDPITSHGVHSAIQGSMQAAIVIHTMLSRGEDPEAAREYYQAGIAFAAGRHRQESGTFYRRQYEHQGGEFWERRAKRADPMPGPETNAETGALPYDVPLRACPRGVRVRTPVILGERITRRMAVGHPQLARPAAFVSDLEVVPLLDLAEGRTARELILRCRDSIHPQALVRALEWLWRNRLLLPASEYR